MLHLALTADEADFLSHQLKRHLGELEDELIHTDKREIQHALAGDFDRVKELEGRITTLLQTLEHHELASATTQGC